MRVLCNLLLGGRSADPHLASRACGLPASVDSLERAYNRHRRVCHASELS